MATTLTDNTRDDIITMALRRLGVIALGETPAAQAVTDAAQALNYYVKQLDADPKLKWKIGTTFLTAAISATDDSFSASTDTLRIEGMYFVDGTTSTRTPLKPMSRQEWIEIEEDNETNGDPKFYHVSRNTDGTLTVNFWPKVANAGTMNYLAKTKLDLYDSDVDQGDVPDALVRHLVLQLAADLAWEYRKDLEEIDRHERAAQASYAAFIESEIKSIDMATEDQPNAQLDKQI